MRDKSKIIGFMLSVIPGLAHLYIGLRERAVIFLGLLGAGFFASVFIGMVTYGETGLILFMIGYSLLWLIALVDLFSAWRKLEIRHLYNSSQGIDDINIDTKINRKTITLALSIIPGAGHMYLGHQNKGLAIMGSFFFSIFFMGWLGISLLLFLLPLIWFYSFFDAMHLVDGSEEIINSELELPKIKPEWLGTGLIAIGIIIILERILYPMIDYHIVRYIQTSIVSLIFIIAGGVILNKDKKTLSSGKEDKDIDEDIVEEDE
ncbi:MAG: hypothetical protein RIN55_00995 [Tissierellaceae bacterium]|nr:hypothetical protein [Tissierellaceae bacterium]